MNYHVADFITRIKNAAMAKRKEVSMPYSKINKAIGELLVKEKFLTTVSEELVDNKKIIKVGIRYENRLPMLQDLILVSKPSLRVYTNAKSKSRKERTSKSTAVLSTSKGIMTGREARQKGIGGELLFEIW